MDFDNPKVFSDTSITDGLVKTTKIKTPVPASFELIDFSL